MSDAAGAMIALAAPATLNGLKPHLDATGIECNNSAGDAKRARLHYSQDLSSAQGYLNLLVQVQELRAAQEVVRVSNRPQGPADPAVFGHTSTLIGPAITTPQVFPATSAGNVDMSSALLAQQIQIMALTEQLMKMQDLLQNVSHGVPPRSDAKQSHAATTGVEGITQDSAGPCKVHSNKSQEDRWAPMRTDRAKDSAGPTSPKKIDGLRCARIVRKAPATRNATVRWTRDEHRNFLRGLELHGTGQWSRISQENVPSRTPAQVASHNQKFVLRSAVPPRLRQKPSILDITTPDVQRMLAEAVRF